MNRGKMVTTLRQIEGLIATCLKELAETPKAPGAIPKRSTERASSERTLPGHILKLRNEGFFKQAKNAGEVHEKLKPTYDCDLNRVEVALLRLSDRKQLRKASKKFGGSAHVAYV